MFEFLDEQVRHEVHGRVGLEQYDLAPGAKCEIQSEEIERHPLAHGVEYGANFRRERIFGVEHGPFLGDELRARRHEFGAGSTMNAPAVANQHVPQYATLPDEEESELAVEPVRTAVVDKLGRDMLPVTFERFDGSIE